MRRTILSNALVLSLILCCWLSDIATAQHNIRGKGTINNIGKLRITGAMDSISSNIGGTFELFGTNQTLRARQYKDIDLKGSGIKTTQGGNFSITNNLTIDPSVTLNIERGSVINLGGNLTEQGTFIGAIQKSVDLSGSTTSSNYGNLGALIAWSASAPGITTVRRASDSVSTGNGNESIRRFYDIQPADASSVASLVFTYSNSDLNGHDASILKLWKSIDEGSTWRFVGGTVDTATHTIGASNIVLAGRWTAADTLHPLGTMAQKGVPTTIAWVHGNNVTGQITTQVDTFSIMVTDAFGLPVKDVAVTFSINNVPANATGQTITVVNTTTDSTGRASTVLTLGNKVGDYVVTASSPGLEGSPILFHAKAQPGPAASILFAAGADQIKPILTQLDSLFTVLVLDAGSNVVPGITVRFAFASMPANASGQSLSDTSIVTDSSGKASTRLLLGNKVGDYIVNATYQGQTSAPIQFTARAIPGPASALQMALGNNQVKPILATLDTSFTAVVTDIGGNLVKGANVQFAIDSIPQNATGQSLSVTSAATDSLGRASTTLTLGNKVGTYGISATSTGLSGSPITFAARAIPGAPSTQMMASGNNQSKPVLSVLDTAFTLTVNDVGGNAVPGDSVTFTVSEYPFDAIGYSLSDSIIITDSLGRASTVLTLGNKIGTYRIAASSTRLTGVPIVFSATAVAKGAASIAAINGMGQSDTITATLSNPLVVRLTDAEGNPVAGTTVEFGFTSVPAGATGQILSATSMNTNAVGAASANVTLGNKVGEYVVTVSSPSIAGGSILFRSTAFAGKPAAVVALSGDGQKGVVNSLLPDRFSAVVTDAGANPVPNTPVNFTIVSIPAGATGQRLDSTVVTTDSIGRASAHFTLGNKSGIYEVSASIAGLPVATFTASASAGAPATIAQISGENQTKPILTSLDTPFVAVIRDADGNPVGGVPIRFTITSQPSNAVSANLSDTLRTTDSLGRAQTTLALGSKVGLYVVEASYAGTQAQSMQKGKIKSQRAAAQGKDIQVFFSAHASYGVPTQLLNIAGDHQIQPTGTALDTAITVTINDIGGNSIPGIPVKFAIITKPADTRGEQLSDTLAITDSLGQARTILQLGDRDGLYQVQASVDGVPVLTFSTTAYLILGDPNGDLEVDIADITLLIDHLRGQKILTWVDSIKADVNDDGNIDIGDINTLRNRLLQQRLVTDSTVLSNEIAASNALSQSRLRKALVLKNQSPTASEGSIEATPYGLRLNLINSEPIRGVELKIRLKQPVAVNDINLLFPRAEFMEVYVQSNGREVTVVMFNMQNREIQPGEGSLIRLPIVLSDSNDVDSVVVRVSTQTNQSVKPPVNKTLAPTGKYPVTYRLEQNYPNPFNGSTTIRFDIPDRETKLTRVVVQIYNSVGQRVRTLIRADLEAGHYTVQWDAKDDDGMQVASGVYFYRLLSKDHLSAKKMLLVK